MTGRKNLTIAVTIVMVAALFCGCFGDGDNGGVKWEKPTQVRVEKVSPNVTAQRVDVTVKMYDAKDQVSQWDVQLRLIAVDTKDFTMLNKTYDIKAKSFKSKTTNNVIDTWYEMSVPFADFAKSHDRVMSLFMTGKQMTIYAWITYSGNTYKQSPTPLITNTVEIPEGLLVPNEKPKADLVGYTTGFVGQELEYNASKSTDDGGFDNLNFEWDWGDGSFAWLDTDPVETHTFEEAGTFTVEVNVSDEEDAFDIKSLSVTISEPLQVTIVTDGINTTPGEHYNDTFVEFTIKNVATYNIDISNLNPVLYNATGTSQANNGTETAPPDELTPDQTVTVKVYFVLPQDYTPTEIKVLGNKYTLT